MHNGFLEERVKTGTMHNARCFKSRVQVGLKTGTVTQRIRQNSIDNVMFRLQNGHAAQTIKIGN